MTEEFGWSRAEFSASRSIGQMVMAFHRFLIGAQIDKHGGRRFILIGGSLLVAALFGLSKVQTLTHWLALNGLVLTAGAAMVGNLVVNVTLGKWFVERRGCGRPRRHGDFALGHCAPDSGNLFCRFLWLARVLAVAGTSRRGDDIGHGGFVVRRAPEDFGWHPDGISPDQISAGQGEAASADSLTEDDPRAGDADLNPSTR